MDPGTVQQHVGDDPPREKLLQLDVELHHREVRDRWMRMRLLDDRESFQRENSADQLQMRMVERDVVAIKLLIHHGLSSHADNLVQEERRDEQTESQASDERTDQEKHSISSICLEGWSFRSHWRISGRG